MKRYLALKLCSLVRSMLCWYQQACIEECKRDLYQDVMKCHRELDKIENVIKHGRTEV